MICIGLKIGRRSEASGLCVTELEWRGRPDRRCLHYVVRHLERVEPGADFPQVGRRAGDIVGKLRARGLSPLLTVDATGLGGPIVDLVRDAASSSCVRPVFFTHGDQLSEEPGRTVLGKAFLVARLQTLLQTDRLHLPKTSESEQLTEDLLAFEVKIDAQANEKYGAFAVGSRDELVTALGLCLYKEPTLAGFSMAIEAGLG